MEEDAKIAAQKSGRLSFYVVNAIADGCTDKTQRRLNPNVKAFSVPPLKASVRGIKTLSNKEMRHKKAARYTIQRQNKFIIFELLYRCLGRKFFQKIYQEKSDHHQHHGFRHIGIGKDIVLHQRLHFPMTVHKSFHYFFPWPHLV